MYNDVHNIDHSIQYTSEIIEKTISDNINDVDHIVRYASPTKVQKGIVSSEIFTLREKDNGYLSCFWYEYRNRDIIQIENDQKGRNLKIKKTGLNILISILKLKELIKTICKPTISVKYLGSDRQDSYSGIYPLDKSLFNEEKLKRELLNSITSTFDINNP